MYCMYKRTTYSCYSQTLQDHLSTHTTLILPIGVSIKIIPRYPPHEPLLLLTSPLTAPLLTLTTLSPAPLRLVGSLKLYIVSVIFCQRSPVHCQVTLTAITRKERYGSLTSNQATRRTGGRRGKGHVCL